MDSQLTPGDEGRQEEPSHVKRAVFAVAVGNTVEWFDYASYTYLATVIAVVFFETGNTQAALIGTFAVFAVSFIARPIGGFVWGHFGDKVGRKKILAITIIIMSLSTFAIGLIPSYATIGIGAPLLLLLCRLVQGFSASGEYAGASAYLAEHAPESKRGLIVSIVPASTAAGLALGAIIATLLEVSLTEAALHSWGWRIPFLLAGPLGFIAMYMRMKLEVSSHFTELEESDSIEASPIMTTIKENRKELLVALGIVCLNAVGFYIILAYLPTYLSEELGFDTAIATLTTIFSLLTYVIFLPIVGKIADKVGRKPVLATACILFVILAYPAFYFLSLGGAFAIGAQILLGAILAGNDGVMATFLTEIFPTTARYSGFGISYNLGNALFGGTAPLIATALIAFSGNQYVPAFMLIVAALVAFFSLFWARETAHEPLKQY